MTPTEYMIMAQQYQAPQGPLQVPRVGLLSVPDMSANYADMSLSDEEMIRKLREMGITLNPGEKITPEMRMKVAAQRIKDIPGNIADIPENMMEAGKNIGTGLQNAATGILDFFR